jgi:carbonic anhydrase/acetyltransferase-like protein (isoleucine patch superfamily)
MMRAFKGIQPQVASSAYVDASAQVIGDVAIGEHSSIWPHAVLRADINSIRIGAYTNIQDHCILHVDEGPLSLSIGDRVTVGHRVILHACRVDSDCLIGMGAVILNNAQIGAGSVIAAGAVVPENTVVPPGSVCMGVPATVRRAVGERDRKRIQHGAQFYARLKEQYLADGRNGSQ